MDNKAMWAPPLLETKIASVSPIILSDETKQAFQLSTHIISNLKLYNRKIPIAILDLLDLKSIRRHSLFWDIYLFVMLLAFDLSL